MDSPEAKKGEPNRHFSRAGLPTPGSRREPRAPNFLLDSRNMCWDFLSLAPVLVIPKAKFVSIRVEDYEAVRNRLENEIVVLRRTLADELKKKKSVGRTRRIIRRVVEYREAGSASRDYIVSVREDKPTAKELA